MYFGIFLGFFNLLQHFDALTVFTLTYIQNQLINGGVEAFLLVLALYIGTYMWCLFHWCQLAECQMAGCQMAECQMAGCQLAECQMAGCQLAECQNTGESFLHEI